MRLGASRTATSDPSSRIEEECNSRVDSAKYLSSTSSCARVRRDPRRVEYLTVAEQVYSTIYAAFKGDLTNLRRDFLRGVDMSGADYDGRCAPLSSPLHSLASSPLVSRLIDCFSQSLVCIIAERLLLKQLKRILVILVSYAALLFMWRPLRVTSRCADF